VTPRRLLVVTARELTRDVRARRQVEAALAAGIDVRGLSVMLAGEAPLPLDGVDVVRVRAGRASARLRAAGLGGMRRSSPLVRELRGLWRLARLTRTTLLLAGAGRGLGGLDLVHANDLDALPGAWLVARRARAALVYDAHELYRLMEAKPPRIYTAIASFLEGAIARRARAVVTNCDLFAAELDRLLRLRRPAVVVLNCPDPVPELPPAPPAGGRLRAIYQAAADHEGRPVSDLLDALAAAPDVELTIRLVDVDRPALEREIAKRGLAERVRVADAVPPDRLVEGLDGFDVGTIVNRETTPNDALAVPGKLWESMMAGLATVAPALPGLVLVDELGVGVAFRPGDVADLARALQDLAADRDSLAATKARARALALERFNSATQAERLLEVWAL
jgi:glycogen(starch) synthase